MVVDVGAEAMLNRRPEGVDLARQVGLEEDIVYPATTSANLWNRGRLVPMPRTMMGVPLDLRGLDGIISARGLARAATRQRPPADRARRAGHQRRRPGRGTPRQGDRRPAGGATPRRGVRRPRPRDLRPGRRTPDGGAARAGPVPDPGRRGGHPTRGPRQPQTRSSPASAGEWVGCRVHSRRRPARPCARAPPCATWPAARTGAGTSWSAPPGTPRSSRPTRSSLATPARATARLLSDVTPAAALDSRADRLRLDGHRHDGLPCPRLPAGPRVRLPGAARRRAVGQGVDVLLRQVGLGAPGRSTGRRG